jgi:3D-(3,5/4)-trihydroxycyclohexane-1,2-dione acylhydrolase (decyclizing)
MAASTGSSRAPAGGRSTTFSLTARTIRSLGATAEKVDGVAGLEAALVRAKASPKSYVIVLDTDPVIVTEAGGAWWDVAVPEVSARPEVQAARRAYEQKLTGESA